MNNTVTSPTTSPTAQDTAPQQTAAPHRAGADPALLPPSLIKSRDAALVLGILAVAALLLVTLSLLLHQELPLTFPDDAGKATRGDVARHYLNNPD